MHGGLKQYYMLVRNIVNIIALCVVLLWQHQKISKKKHEKSHDYLKRKESTTYVTQTYKIVQLCYYFSIHVMYFKFWYIN